jgi:hypothetical protein
VGQTGPDVHRGTGSLFFLREHLAVGVLVEERRTEDFGLTGVVVVPDAEETRPPVMMSVIA